MSDSAQRRKKIVILTNLLAPQRMPIFERLSEHFELTVLYSGEESNREQWKDLEDQVTGFRVERLRGVKVSWTEREESAVMDHKHLHLDSGLSTALLRLRPDAIITAEMGFRSLIALAYGRLYGRPVWVWWGGTLHTERRVVLAKRIFRQWFVARVDRWFTYGSSSTEYLTSLGVPKCKMVELQNCVPEGAYLKTQPSLVELNVKPVLLCVGQLIGRKGVDLLLDAAAQVQAQGLTFSLLVVGSGPEKQRLEQRARKLGLYNVYFHPPQPPKHMPGVYRSADVFVFPTREDVWGLVVNEALWSGLPALVSVYAGCASELVPRESTFDPLDAADFAAKLCNAIKGELPPPDPARLRPINEVTDTIIRELNIGLRIL